MRSLLHRLGVVGLLLGGAVLETAACGGAAASDLDNPPSESAKDSGVKVKPDATGGSSSGDEHDAMDTDATDVDPVDAMVDTGSMDDAGEMASDAAPEGGSLCGPCSLGNRCCTSKAALSYAQCYSPACVFCCP
jgi:hypothetical protein